MASTRYAQLCALARAAEVVGERWTLLVVRELLAEPRRFGDLRGRLPGISTSVLAERLLRLEGRGVVERRVLPPPSATTVYALTPAGQALRPAVLALARWGSRFLLAARARERVEPEWLRLALEACAAEASPARAFLVRVREPRVDLALRVTGGAGGTRVGAPPGRVDATLTADARTLLALVTAATTVEAALRDGRLTLEGERAIAADFPRLFRP